MPVFASSNYPSLGILCRPSRLSTRSTAGPALRVRRVSCPSAGSPALPVGLLLARQGMRPARHPADVESVAADPLDPVLVDPN